jgi:predicted dehydrogenase
MTAVNICILGCGAIARLHTRIAKTLKGDVKISFASRSLERAQEYNRKFSGAGAYGSYDDACASSDVDAVFICTPHAYHLEHARLAARHGKPMLIEKPITRTLYELADMEAAVSEAGVACMVAENYHFKPLVSVLRHHIDAGDIGDPLFLEINKTGTSKNTGWRTDAELMGGGALLEGGVHWVNLFLNVGGTPSEVIAAKPMVPYPPAAPFEDNLEVLVKFQSGAVGKLLHSWRTFNRTAGLSSSKLYGTAGNITFESNGLWAVVSGKRKRIRIPGVLDIMGYRGMLKAFARTVRDGEPAAMSLATARRDMELVFAAYRSLESGRFEPVGATVHE